MLSKYDTDYVDMLLTKYTLRIIEQGLIESLQQTYPKEVDEFMGSFMAISQADMRTFHESLLEISSDNELTQKLVRDNNFKAKFAQLLENPSQEDFYGTEGWEHFLGLD